MSHTYRNDASLRLGIAAILTFACADALSHLVGNGSFFATTADSLPFANGKSYFESGLIVAELVLITAPSILEKHRRILGITAGTLLVVAVGLLIASSSSLLPAGISAAGLLVAFGTGFMTVKFCAVLALVRARSLPIVVLAVLGGKALKALLVIVIFNAAPGDQVLIAVVLAGLGFAGAIASTWLKTPDGMMRNSATCFSVPYLASQIILSAVVLASLQAFTPFSIHGTAISTGAAFVLPYLISTAAMIAVGWLVLGKPQTSAKSFRNAFLILLLGLLLSLSWDAGGLGLAALVDACVTGFFEPLGHGVFWVATIMTCWRLNKNSLRIIGLGMLAFSLIELLWIVLITNLSPAFNVLVALVAYGSIVMFNHISEQGDTIFSPKNASSHESDGTASDAHLEALAAAHDLSPRETEVFMLLARGRTRRYIQERLFISDSTVKTHITRIYRKFDASNKQEFLDKVLEKS